MITSSVINGTFPISGFLNSKLILDYKWGLQIIEKLLCELSLKSRGLKPMYLSTSSDRKKVHLGFYCIKSTSILGNGSVFYFYLGKFGFNILQIWKVKKLNIKN